ncbi:MAG: hypothetical protein IKE69_12790 [Thermoguttaceae bacterium]|nr:hypothetical protein [Thermoguttaceae bacterium]
MKKNPPYRRLHLESLEPRALLAVFAGSPGACEAKDFPMPTEEVRWEVNTNDDPTSWSTTDGVVSLREAIARASSGDRITFTAAVARKTITLHGSPLEIYKGITISGTPENRVTIDGDGKSCVFYVGGVSDSVPVSLNNLVVTGGKGTYGGGISNYGTLTVAGCLVTANSSAYGGGLYNGGGKLTLSVSTIAENAASGQGGGIYNTGALAIAACDIFRNGASSGGALYHYSGTVSMTNCALCENSSAYNGGGIYAGSGTMTLTNCTVAANNTGEFYAGGGVYSGAKNAFFYNTLVVQNVAGAGADVSRASGALHAFNTISGFTGWTDSTDCPEYDPSLPLFESGPYGDYALAENSQAINKGENAFIEGYTTDLAQNERIAGGIVDLGAFEYPLTDPDPTPLETPVLLTGGKNYFVSGGANRHLLTWTEVENASGYEVACSAGGELLDTVVTTESSVLMSGLAYGAEVIYNIRALGEGLYADSAWSGDAPFYVCPIDINGDGDISGSDLLYLTSAWLSEEGDDNYLLFCDIDADGNITNFDRAFLVMNWLTEAEEVAVYPRALAAELSSPRDDSGRGM